MTRTTVVNLKADEYDVYIGRAMPGFPASVFANPFRIGPDGSRSVVIAKYRDWLTQQPHLMRQLAQLKGKRLGCWCKPQDCHGDVICELLDGPPEPEIPVQGSLF